MKAIFLDIDGVLNNILHIVLLADKILGKEQYLQLFRACKETPFDYRSCKLMQQLISETNAKVILSSTWRLGKYRTELIQKYAGIKVDDKTPVLNTKRGEEIKCYLKEHPEITHYVIIDDDLDFLDEQKKNLCHVDRNSGFSEKNYKKCLEILNNEKFNYIN